MKISRILLIISLITYNVISAQETETEISKEAALSIIKDINSSILNAKNFSANLRYNIYKNHLDSQALKSIEGFYRRSGTKEHSMLVGVETIQNSTERLIVDTSSQSIALTNSNPKLKLIDESMNSALIMCRKITKTSGNGYSILKLYLGEKSNSGFSSIEISYTKDYFIRSMTLYYINAVIPDFESIKNPKIEIVYMDVSTSRISQSEFSTDLFIEKKIDTFLLKEKYKNYSFSNQLTSNKHL